MKLIPKDELIGYCVKVFESCGVPSEDARMASEALVLTDMRGIWSHGVMRVAHYVKCLQSGGLKADNNLTVLDSGPAFLRLSAGGGMGIPASIRAIDMTIELAKKSPVVITTVSHSDHYGAAGLYAMRCADAGLVGYSMSNTCPMIAITGSSTKGIGNNPFAYAAPGRKYRGVLFDVCMSVVASGKVQIAHAEGKKIPFGWIIDKDGNPTDDPGEIYKNGTFLPFGGHKGYGFAVMVEMMTSTLAGAGMMGEVRSWNKTPGRESNTGHCFMAMNPEFFGGLEQFRSRMDEMIDNLTSLPRVPGCDKIYYPGEIEFEHEAEALEKGVPLTQASMDEMNVAAQLTGIPFDL